LTLPSLTAPGRHSYLLLPCPKTRQEAEDCFEHAEKGDLHTQGVKPFLILEVEVNVEVSRS
jgi:hypothetical protein